MLKDRLKDWIGKNTAMDIIGPIVADYDLKQCVELKIKISKHIDKSYLIAVPLCLVFVFISLGYLGISKLLAGYGLIQLDEHDTTGLAFLVFGIMVMWAFFGYVLFLSRITAQCNHKIKEIAGVSDGEETQS